MKLVADTDVLIDFLRGTDTTQSKMVELELKRGSLNTTAISAFELWAGAKSKKQKLAVEALLTALIIFPLNQASARKAAEIRIDLETRGEGIGMADSLIAGICVDVAAIFLTRNTKHFKRIKELQLASE